MPVGLVHSNLRRAGVCTYNRYRLKKLTRLFLLFIFGPIHYMARVAAKILKRQKDKIMHMNIPTKICGEKKEKKLN